MTSASYARRAPEREILANLGHRSARLPARPPVSPTTVSRVARILAVQARRPLASDGAAARSAARPASAPSSARCRWFCPRQQEGELPLGEERCRTLPPRGLTGEGLLNGGQGLLAALPAWASRSSAAGRTRCILAKKPIRKPSCRICTPSLPTRHGATFRRAPGRCQVVACMRNDLLLTCSGIPVDRSEPQTPRRFREIRGRTRPPSRTRLHGLAENKQQGVPTFLTP